jgi:predicted secreted protein
MQTEQATQPGCGMLLSFILLPPSVTGGAVLSSLNKPSVLFCFLLAACLLITGPPSGAQEEFHRVRLTEKDNGSSVTLRVGQKLEVLLPASLGTGYGWTVSSIPNQILKALEVESRPETDKNKVGGPEHQLFCFVAIAGGSAHLELQYKRPWDKTSADAKKYSLLLQVQ